MTQAQERKTYKKYVTEDGDCLKSERTPDGWVLFWFICAGEYAGAVVGEDSSIRARATPPKDKGEWEVWIVDRACEPFASERTKEGFIFRSARSAHAALRAANEALNRGEGLPWPDWAMQAQAAGWTPPEGWKP